MKKHFSSVTNDKFVENLQKYSPDFLDRTENLFLVRGEGGVDMDEIVCLQLRSVSLPLDAYLASALTGLTENERTEIFAVSDIVAGVCKEFDIELYEPRKHTDPVAHAGVTDSDVFRIDRERVLKSDLVVVLSHHPSFGAGEELDFAFTALVPIIIISRSEHKVSRMVTGIPAFKLNITYRDSEDLEHGLKKTLMDIRPLLEQRKLAFAEKYDVNIVGERICLRRQQLGLTREDVARSVRHLTVDGLKQTEEATDRLSNPSLLYLREIATVLKTTVADLVEPDLVERLMAYFEDWLEGRVAARFGEITPKDRKKIIRRVLLRVIDSLEKE